MPDSVLNFYDSLAEDYHLQFANWADGVRWQGEALHNLIRKQLNADPPQTVLDCSCGIGTQAIGLALQGYEVHGTDLSPASINRARTEARFFDVEMTFGVADFRNLDVVEGKFDVVISCDNSLPHLQSEDDLLKALNAMKSRLNSGGLLLISIRDYDQLLEERPQTTPLRVIDDDNGRRITFQVWDWYPDNDAYVINHFILHQQGDNLRTIHHQTEYAALRRADLSRLLEKAGFHDIQWHMTDVSDYYQPIVTARI
jgi:SAM-dependent methyltransferase